MAFLIRWLNRFIVCLFDLPRAWVETSELVKVNGSYHLTTSITYYWWVGPEEVRRVRERFIVSVIAMLEREYGSEMQVVCDEDQDVE